MKQKLFPNKFQILLVCIFYCVHWTKCLDMKGVMLAGKKDHLRMQSDKAGVLECHFDLKEGESAKVITWYHDDHMILKWGPPEPAQLGENVAEGTIALTREDGHLEFLSLKSNLDGIYRCEVFTTKAETFKSPDYQLLLVDMPDIPDNAKYKVENCSINFSWEAPAIRPRPEVACGIWSAKHGYTLKATSWMAVPYYNGSIAYSLEHEKFKITNMPLDAVIRCEIKMTKIDDSEVKLLDRAYNFTEVKERGCPPLEIGEGVNLKYDNERITCRAEIKSKDETAPVIAHLTCQNGFLPKYKEFVTSVDMVCKDTEWTFGGDLTWSHFDNLVCETEPKIPDLPPQSMQASLTDDSSGVNRVAPWTLGILLSICVLSGLVWGIRHLGKKKDPRYMA